MILLAGYMLEVDATALYGEATRPEIGRGVATLTDLELQGIDLPLIFHIERH